MERAEAVKRYLYEQHQIPLHKMNVISYGEEKPVAPNKTRDGRAQNRRVVIKILGVAIPRSPGRQSKSIASRESVRRPR